MTDPVTHSLVRNLREVDDFAGLDDKQLLETVGAAANLLWSEGTTIFSAGDGAQAIYIILRGRVRLEEGEGGDLIAELGPGSYFGEQALLLHTRRSATAVAVEDCELMVIDRSRFESLLEADAEVARRFRTKLEERLAARDGAPTSSLGSD